MNKQNFNILYVEDEIEIREKYSKYLTRFVSTVYVAKDGEEAYAIYKEKRPDIIIADINMPKLNGLELASKIRKDDHNTKIIILTAHSHTDYLLKATDLKLTKYLIKPVIREDLTNAISLAIEELLNFSTFSKNIIQLRKNCHWDSKSMKLYLNGTVTSLTKNEKILTDMLISKVGTTFSYEEISYQLWPDEFKDKLPAIKTLVKGLRKKLPEDCLENVRSVGYRINL